MSRQARDHENDQGTRSQSDSTIIASWNGVLDEVDVQDDDGLNTRGGYRESGLAGVADSRRSPNFLLFRRYAD